MITPTHLNALTIPLLDGTEQERVAWIQQDHWVHTPSSQIAFQWMEYLLRSERRIRPNCLQIVAAAGMGKSALLRKFAELHPVAPSAEPLRLQRPVLLANATGEGRGINGLRDAIMKGAWPDAWERGRCSVSDLDATLVAQGVRLILLDETGELLRCGPSLHLRLLGELKRITNERGINIVSATVQGLDHALKQDTQLYSRFKRVIRIPCWVESQELRNFLYGLEQFLPFPRRSHLDSESIVRLLAAYGDGNTETITDLIRNAALFALERGAHSVEEMDLNKARDCATPPSIALRKRA